jgi:transposase
MGKPYSLDLRERIVGYVAEGHSARAAGRVFGVSAATAVRLASAHRASGSVAPKLQGRAPGTAGKLAPHRDFLVAAVRANPDLTLHELAAALEEATGITVHISSVHRALARAGLSYKKRADRRGAGTVGDP